MSTQCQRTDHTQRHYPNSAVRRRINPISGLQHSGLRRPSDSPNLRQQHRERDWLLQCCRYQRPYLQPADVCWNCARCMRSSNDDCFIRYCHLWRSRSNNATSLCSFIICGCCHGSIPAHLLLWSSISELAGSSGSMVEQLCMGGWDDLQPLHATKHQQPDR